MSKLDWLRQGSLWMLRVTTKVLSVTTHPFRTGSWRKRAAWGLVATTIVGGTGYRCYHGSWWPVAAAVENLEVDFSPKAPGRANANPVVPLAVGDEQDSLLQPSAKMFSARRHPAVPSDEEGDRQVMESTSLPERPRFGQVTQGRIRPVNNEQPEATADRRSPFSRFRDPSADDPESQDPEASTVNSARTRYENDPTASNTGEEMAEARPSDVPSDSDVEAEGNGPVITAEPDESIDQQGDDSNDTTAAQLPAGSGRFGSPTRSEPLEKRPVGREPAPPAELPGGLSGPRSGRARESEADESSVPRPLRAFTSSPARDSRTSISSLAVRAEADVSNASPNPGSRQLEGTQSPSVTIEKVAPTDVQVGRPATFQLKVRNVGKVHAHEVVVVDVIPDGVDVLELQPQAEPGAEGRLVWNLGMLAPGAESTIVMKVLPQREGEIGSVAEVTFRAQASVRTISTKPQISMRLDGPRTVLAGEIANVNLTITNTGTGIAANLFLDAIIPDGFVHPAGRELQSPLGNLPPNGSKTISLPLKAAKAGSYDLTFSATNEVNVSVEEQLPIEVTAPEFELAIQGPKVRYLDRQTTYSVWLSNPGTAAAEEVELVLFLSKGLKFVSSNNQGQYDRQSHAVFWNLERLPPSAKGEVQVVLLPGEIGQQKVRAEARGASGLQQTDERVLQVDGLPELQFSVSDTEDPVDVGSETQYEVLIVNKGSQAANHVQLTVEFPSELEPLRGNGPTEVQVRGNTATGEPLARLAPNEKAVYKITARGLRAGDCRVRVQIVSDDVRNPVTKEERTLVHADAP